MSTSAAKSMTGEWASTTLLALLGNAVVRSMKERLKPFDLHPRHYAILQKLERSPGTTQQALSDHIQVHRSAMVGLLDQLEARDFVFRKRNAQNRREQLLYLTETGAATLHEMEAISQHYRALFLSPLDEEEQLVLQRLLTRLVEGLDEDPDPAD